MTNAGGELGTGPVTAGERLEALDVLRGFAILGILVMNIQSFAMIGSAYLNPHAFGDLTGPNYLVWLAGHLLFDRKFLTLFALLFGAGIILMTQRRAAAGRQTAGLHFRRMLVLLAIGFAHAYLIWYGDILVTYALCGLIAFLFHKRSARTLIPLGLLLIAIPTLISTGAQLSMPQWPEAERLDLQQSFWNPTDAVIAAEVDAYRGSWLAQQPHRIDSSRFMQTQFLLVEGLWRVTGLMLIGMALMKWQVFSAARRPRTYVTLAIIGFGLGLPIVVAGVVFNTTTGWKLEYSFFAGAQFNYWGSLFVALGWLSLVMLICRQQWLPAIRHRLAAVGRMALSAYLLQSILGTLIFYGHGLGLFGQVPRVGQLAIVLGIWIVLLIACPLWLRYFRFGPAEWLWRSLTYMKPPPMHKHPATTPVAN
jgi:uncharacterized protein